MILALNIAMLTNVSEHLHNFKGINFCPVYKDIHKFSFTGEQHSPFLEFDQEKFSFYDSNDVTNYFIAEGDDNFQIHS